MTEPIHPDDIERAAVALQALRRKYRDGGVADWDRMQAEAVLAAVGPAIYARGQRSALTQAADDLDYFAGLVKNSPGGTMGGVWAATPAAGVHHAAARVRARVEQVNPS